MLDKGDKLEAYVAAKLEQVWKYSRPTIASGATPAEKGDVKNPYFCIECKNWATDSFSIKNDVWEKLKVEAASEYKDPVYVVENASGHRLALMDLDDWFNLVYELLEYRGNDKLMNIADNECPFCGETKSIKFPCCGFFCLNCGKTFEEDDSKTETS